MTPVLPPYPAYKDSCIPWLGRIPAHWEVLRLGAVLGERGETNAQLQTENVLSVLRNRGVIPYAEKGNIGNKKSEDITRYKIVRPDDIVVNSMNVIIGSVGLSRYNGCLSPVYYVLTRRNPDDDPRYLNAYFQYKTFQESLVRLGNGILAHRMRIPMEKLKAELFPVPPPEEQRAIARYLDWADVRIRRLIDARQRQVKLLEETKQALIHQAVTGQIDVRTGKPYAEYKESGVEWLGRVPGHWEVVRVRYFAKVGNGSTPSRGRSDYWKRGHFPWLNSSVVNLTRIKTADQFVTTTALSECHLPILDPGTVLVAITGQGKTRGKSAVLDIKATINQHLAYIAIRNSRVWPEFLRLFLDASYKYLRSISDDAGSTKGALTCEDLKRLEIMIPPKPEQRMILQHITDATDRIDSILKNTRRSIDLLKEYRTRLIADVVTGKVDVREAAGRLEEEMMEGVKALEALT